MRKKLYVSQFDDPYLQQNFKSIGEVFSSIPFLKGQWRFYEFEIKSTGSNIKIPHNLGFQPKDIFVTSVINGTITFNYSSFDNVNLDLNATVSTSPMTVRAFVGRYTEDTVNV
jgi:hypothetical protein